MRQEGIEGLTKQELVDRINNDINVWKVSQEEQGVDELNLEEMVKQEIEEEVHYKKAA